MRKTTLKWVDSVVPLVLLGLVLGFGAVGKGEPGGALDLSKLPETPAAERFVELMQELEDGNTSEWREWLKSSFDPRLLRRHTEKAVVSTMSQLREWKRRLEFVEVGTSTETRFSVIGREKQGGFRLWFELYVEARGRAPHLLIDFDVVRSSPPPSVLQQKISQGDLVTELEAYVGDLIERDQFSGVFLVARGEKILVEAAGGLASHRYGVPNRIGTGFCLGSMTKMFTAVAIGKLIEKGELSLEDSIGEYLGEEWVTASAGKKIQIKHLLTHSGGTGDFFRHPDYRGTARSHFREVDGFSDFIDIQEPEFEPGSRFSYSNSGFILLGAILEEVTGQNYHEFMRSSIYEPLGMENTDCYEWDRPVSNLAVGYYRERDGGLRSNVFLQRVRGCPAGSGYSTVRDLHRFAGKLMAGEVLGPEMMKLMTTPNELEGSNYGYGFEISRIEPQLQPYGHSGGGPGVSARFFVYPDSEFIVVILSNYGHAARMMAYYVHELIARFS